MAKRSRRPLLRAVRAASPAVQALIVAVFVFLAWASINWIYQTIGKPTELLFPLSGALAKNPPATWQAYGPLFREHATAVITPDLLAALAQVEGAGNPVARTYWRWRASSNPFELYRPASSAVGMYQMTDATFDDAKRYCIHDHVAVEDGPWDDVKSCWFNRLYARVVPGDAIELTSAWLDRAVATALARQRGSVATLQQKQDLAALIHLCGRSAGEEYVKRRFRLAAHQRCGDHDVRNYLRRVTAMKRAFGKLAAADRAS
jgi:hypothetical protein